jgi:hypothetical protein
MAAQYFDTYCFRKFKTLCAIKVGRHPVSEDLSVESDNGARMKIVDVTYVEIRSI